MDEKLRGKELYMMQTGRSAAMQECMCGECMLVGTVWHADLDSDSDEGAYDDGKCSGYLPAGVFSSFTRSWLRGMGVPQEATALL